MIKRLAIITGPVGSGKTTKAAQLFPDRKVFDRDLSNKEDFKSFNGDAVLCAAAPARETKQYWLDRARTYGFEPELLVIWVPRMVAYSRMSARNALEFAKKRELERSIDWWYKKYSRHSCERRVIND